MKIICIGRNYSEHAQEMKADVPTEPIFFMKADISLLKEGSDFYYPDFTNDLHYECELVLKIDKPGKNIHEKFASKYYSTIGLGIDFTARDLQERCKQNGLPWEIAKSFENSAAISTKFISLSDLNKNDINFELKKNGLTVQRGNSRQLIFDFDKIISYVSRFMTLKTGDLIYTGTPAGVGPTSIGDLLEGFLEGEQLFSFSVK